MEESILKKIGEILGYQVDDDLGIREYERVTRVADLVATTAPDDPNFEDIVLAAEATLDQQGNRVFMHALGVVTAPPPERVYKIKRSQKGQRIKEKSPSGRNFAFGPVWCDAVKGCKNMAVLHNREKLNMHGKHVGVESPETMTARELCLAIAARMPS